jgi:D-serine deaminase-like pyridoxal phosphate-dependent protein
VIPAATARADPVGRELGALTTPALVVDLDIARANVERMGELVADAGRGLRPHAKAHKCAELARMQLAAGAIGVTTATAEEALALAAAGIDPILIANQIAVPAKLELLARAAADRSIALAVDDAANLQAVSDHAVAAGSTVGILVEVDVGMGRCGVRTKEEALRLAEHVVRTPGVRLRGMQGYEGHCMLEPDYDRRVGEAHAATAKLVEAIDLLAASGFPSEVVSAGGTGTYLITGANPRVTEIQAGSYALMDAFHGNLVPGGFEVALTVLTSAISRQGGTVVFDAGRKAVGIDFVSPPLVGHPDAQARYFAEEHSLFDFPGTPPFDLGDRAELVGGYGPTTVNLYDVFHVVEGGVVTDIWPVSPRGPGRIGA